MWISYQGIQYHHQNPGVDELRRQVGEPIPVFRLEKRADDLLENSDRRADDP